jgi:hypothetical protein
MKKILLGLVATLVVAAGLIYVFRGALWETATQRMTADMFIEADTDDFDPGLPIGAQFPTLHASYQGAPITDAGQFIHDKGMVFIANRSANW